MIVVLDKKLPILAKLKSKLAGTPVLPFLASPDVPLPTAAAVSGISSSHRRGKGERSMEGGWMDCQERGQKRENEVSNNFHPCFTRVLLSAGVGK